MGTRTVVKYHEMKKTALEAMATKGGKTGFRAKMELEKRSKK